MPIFDYECPECKAKKVSLLVKKYDEDVPCDNGCSVYMKKLMNYAPAVHGIADTNTTTKDSDVDEILDNTLDNLT